MKPQDEAEIVKHNRRLAEETGNIEWQNRNGQSGIHLNRVFLLESGASERMPQNPNRNCGGDRGRYFSETYTGLPV